MTEWFESDLRDPSPPVPGERERAAVAVRAAELGRRRRILQGAGALGMVAALAVGVAALTAGGSSSGSGDTNHIDAASPSASTAPTVTAAPTTAAPPVTTAPATTAPPAVDPGVVEAPAPATEPQPQPEAAPPAPVLGTVSGTVTNIPAGVTVTVSLSPGSFSATVDGAGHYSIAGVPAGTYTATYQWDANDGTAAHIVRVPGITIDGDKELNFALQ
jgi:hypothetical protein